MFSASFVDEACSTQSSTMSAVVAAGLSIRPTPAPDVSIREISSMSAKKTFTVYPSESVTVGGILNRALPPSGSTGEKAPGWVTSSPMATVEDTTGIDTHSPMVSVVATDIIGTSALPLRVLGSSVRLHSISSSGVRTYSPVVPTRSAGVKQIANVRASTPLVTAPLPALHSLSLGSGPSVIIQSSGRSSYVPLSLGSLFAMGSSKMAGSSLRATVTPRRDVLTHVPSLPVRSIRSLGTATSVTSDSSQSVAGTGGSSSSSEFGSSIASVLTANVLTSTRTGFSEVSAMSQAGVSSLSSAVPAVVLSSHHSSVSSSLVRESTALTISLTGSGYRRDGVSTQSKIATIPTRADRKPMPTSVVQSSKYVDTSTLALISSSSTASAAGLSRMDGVISLDASTSNMPRPITTVGNSKVLDEVTLLDASTLTNIPQPTTTVGMKKASDGDTSLDASTSNMPGPIATVGTPKVSDGVRLLAASTLTNMPQPTTTIGMKKASDRDTLLDSSTSNNMPQPTVTATVGTQKADGVTLLDASISDDIRRPAATVGSLFEVTVWPKLVRSSMDISYLVSPSQQILVPSVVNVFYSDGTDIPADVVTFIPGSGFMKQALETTSRLHYIDTVTAVSQSLHSVKARVRAAGTLTPTQVTTAMSAIPTVVTPAVVDVSGQLMKLSQVSAVMEISKCD